MAHEPIELLNSSTEMGRVRHGLFDFDGTISVIREGWERVMAPMMVETIAGEAGDPDGAIRREVEHYVDESTGLQTILQMDWLVKRVARHRGAGAALSAEEYKAIYNRRLLGAIRGRLGGLERGKAAREELMIAGAEDFVRALAERGVTLYVASGTDVEDVRHEAAALGVAHYFRGGIFGAVGASRACSKAAVIRDILETHGLEGPELLVVGDGPVEIREGKARGAVTVGVASDEVRRRGLNPRKRERLVAAGADIVIPDFTAGEALLALLLPAGT
ncbi:MAG TPA: HAD family hydrolase [Planctomycetota bacterium]|nr:HAD family hydrolase [Planctomycetota bacterium]